MLLAAASYLLAGMAAFGAYPNVGQGTKLSLWFLFPLHLAFFHWMNAVWNERHHGIVNNKALWAVLGPILCFLAAMCS